MHFPKVLEKYGCSSDRLREIFTSTCPAKTEDMTDEEKKKYERQEQNSCIRKRFEKRVWSRMLEGIEHNARNARLYQAIDMAWDAMPIQKEMVPLMMWASGKIKKETLYSTLCRDVGESTAKKFIKKSPTGDSLDIDWPRITETNVNIVRSYVTRRLAAMDALWANLYPMFKYDPRGKSDVSQFCGDVVTERVDMMTDQFGYRHMGTQWNRDQLLYGRSCAFPRSAWVKKIGWRFKSTNDQTEPTETESYIRAEGVDMVNLHPSRYYYDRSAPLSGINTDNGPRWIGYYDIVRYGTICDAESSYYNLKDVVATDDWTNLTTEYPEFFGFHFDPTVLAFPEMNGGVVDFNDRKAQIGRYSANLRDKGLLIGQHFECINPKTEGIGDYDSEIWIRLVVGGSGTIIGAEFMPSIPACTGSINWNDSRDVNQSMASELLVYQDQMSNIVTQMIEQLRSSFVQLWLLDKDSLEEKTRKEIEDNAKNRTWWLDPHVLVYSATKLKEMGIQDPRQAFAVIQTNVQNTVSQALTAMGQLLNICDRLMILSPNELGQPNPREVAAREVQEMSTSVQSIYSFINQGPREQRTAFKQLLFESLVTNGHPIVKVPVMGMYRKETLEQAGFKVVGADLSDNGTYVPSETPVEGPLNKLVYEYYFDSREGSERAANAQGAQAMVQLLQVLVNTPGIVQKLGLDRLLDFVNTIIRMTGAPTDLQIEKNDGESDSIQPPDQPPAPPDPMMQQIVQVIQNLGARMDRVDQMLGGGMPPQAAQNGQPPPAPPTGAPPVGAPGNPTAMQAPQSRMTLAA